MGGQVVDLVAAYLSDVRPSGEIFLRASCPLCGSSSRSFSVHSGHGGWNCFSCGESGSLVQFLYKVGGMRREQVDRTLKGVRLEAPLTPRERRRRALKKVWSVLPEFILGAYDAVPPQSLLDKGFDEQLLRDHDVGFDARNDRTTFAIRDLVGRLVAVSGRAEKEWQIPKYKVYDAKPSSPTRKVGEFHGVMPRYTPANRDHLYGFHTVYPVRYQTLDEASLPPLIITEGYKSTLWLRQLGFSHAIGLQGSSISPGQLRMLQLLQGPFYLMLDHEPGKNYPDRNGRCAAVSILRQLQRIGPTKLCLFVDGRRNGTAPDDIHDAEELTYMVQTSKTLTQIRLHRN